ncbi:MAG: ABC transporter permease [Gemmatimonadetes bacterium]|nr:ABC transporter permease [Gemmatimonadota bacterium]
MTAPISTAGRAVTRWLSQLGALARFFGNTVFAWRSLPGAGRRVAGRVFVNQIWFTAVQAIPLVIVLAGILSFLLINQAVRELGRINSTELIGTLMVVAIVRELGPLLTALIVAGRSGTAIAAELATNQVMGEVEALEGMGIDPLHYLVLPRFGGAIVSVFGLIILFDLVAILAGLVAASANDMNSLRYFEIVLRSLTLRDTWLTVGKGLVFGVIIGTVPSFHGLGVRRAATEVPIAASRAVVTSTVGIFLVSALFVALG